MICGVDEAGRGPVIGPMVVAGVLLESESQLVHLNVKDSKKVTPKRREALAQEISKIAQTQVIIVPALDIDAMRQSLTMNAMEVKLFASIIEKLRPRLAYIDSADVNEERFGDKVKAELGFEVEIVSRHGADETYPIVSAASIIAKTARDAEVRKIREKIGEEIGSGYPSDKVTIRFLEEWVKRKGSLPPHTRHSWKTAQRILDNAKTMKIDEF
ncbi:MAG: ribonuclease HII [Thermoplasmata archaeon]|nr:MAG: ribonuclease HII [Thermoplasmata archaeon]